MFNKFKDQLEGFKEKAGETFSESRDRLSKTYEEVSSQARERLSEQTPNALESWCSWCGDFSNHTLMEEIRIGRSIYKCDSCDFPTVSCRYCDNMAKGASLDVNNSDLEEDRSGKISTFFKDNWNNELCSEHDGTMPDFSRANETINDLSAFPELMTPKRKNIYGTAKKTAAISGGVAAIGSGAVLAAPGIAAGLGAAGYLGAAGTGTAISSLKGAALTSAAVAKLGTGGLAIVSASGAGLGGMSGFGIANAYLKDVPDFDFTPLREVELSTDHSIIVVNGFLTEGKEDTTDWYEGLREYQADSQLWHLTWEAKTLRKLGGWINNWGAKGASAAAGKTFIRAGSRKLATGTNAVGWMYAATELVSNPWHSAMCNAEKTGAVLAEAISRTEGKTYTLMGHSLGARVAFFALMALATKDKKYVNNAILMGGAVGREDWQAWEQADRAVENSIYNCYSQNDKVLQYLYQGANLGLSKPAGLGKATAFANNIDCTDFIDDHGSWKEQLPTVLDRIQSVSEEGND